jgi:membrane protein implicated in regulation of membrane protease activity
MLSDLLSQVGMLSWLAIAFIAAVVEVSIPHFGMAFVSIGAIAAAAAAYFGYGLLAQFGTFIVVMVVSLVTLRAQLLARFAGKGVPSRTDPLIGKQGIVTQEVHPEFGRGRITVAGQDWAAKSADTIEVGAKVKVVGADGIVLEVARQ